MNCSKLALAVLVFATTPAFAKGAKSVVRKVSSVESFPAKSVSKKDCLDNGGKANDGANGKDLVCQGGKFDSYMVVTCDYQLDGEAYVGKDDGTLKFYSKTYRCETIKIGDSERALCKVSSSKSKNFDLMVAFDGAENDFFVFSGLDSDKELCHSIAKDGKKK